MNSPWDVLWQDEPCLVCEIYSIIVVQMKPFRIVYFLLPLCVGVVALVLYLLFKDHVPFPPSENANLCYAFSILTSLVVILGAWLPLHYRHWSPLLRMGILETAADTVLVDYFVFGDSNLIYSLALLAVVYLYLWPKIQEEEE